MYSECGMRSYKIAIKTPDLSSTSGMSIPYPSASTDINVLNATYLL
jgi:hypothetical protein